MFLSCGETLTDLVVTEDVASIRAVPGGGPANAARALAQAGVPTSFFGGFSTDAFGRAQRAAWSTAGVDVSQSVTSNLPSALAVAETTGEHTRYGFHLDGTSAFTVHADHMPTADPSGTPFEVVHIGGLGSAVSPFADALRTTAPAWRASGALLSYDPNIRAGFEHRGQDLASVEAWIAQVDIVKVSVDDLALLAPDVDPHELLGAWLDTGPTVVVLTDGPRAVTARTSTTTAVVHPDPLPDDQSPIGAGDAFTAGLLAALRDAGLLVDRHRLSATSEPQLLAALTYAAGRAASALLAYPATPEGDPSRAPETKR